MPDTALASLRRICANLAKLEPLVADYHAKLAAVDAAILTLDPQLWLPPRRYKPNPVFKRQELPRLTLAILREAKGPLAVRDIAHLALAAKGRQVSRASGVEDDTSPVAAVPGEC
jgi:hypothetical protein